MPRYIDADALIEKIQETVCTKCGDIYDGIKCKSCGIDDTLNFLEDAPTADVVPRDEVAKIFEEIESVLFTVASPSLSTDGTIEVKHSKDFHIRREDYYTIKEKYTKGGGE